jgi:hypothetical protein
MPEHGKGDPAPKVQDAKKEFMCEGEGCAAHKHGFRIGSRCATALAGFIAGALVVFIALYPWLSFVGQLCK